MMPRTRTVAPAVKSDVGAELRALTAAGRRLPSNPDRTSYSRSERGWQDQTWRFYDLIGEYRYACDWVGNILSKASLYVAKDGERIREPADAADYVFSLFGGPEAQGQMLRELGIHMTVAGEAYLVGVVVDDVEVWRVVAATELSARAGRYYAHSKEIKTDSGKPFLARVWRPHPRKWKDATSPSRAVLPILSELDALTKRIFAEIDSRLAGAGVFFVPSEMSIPTSTTPPENGIEQPSTATLFQDRLSEAMMTALSDREDASAMVPIVVTAPGEHIGNVKHQTFWSPLDEKSIELRTEAIRRLALGLDMPPEVLTGVADVNHWTAWSVEEGAIKAHAEPLLALICDSLTEAYLRPLLLEDGMDVAEASTYTISADTSQMRLRPNRSKEAFELYDRMEIDGDALRRETGFDNGDAPTQAELRDLFLRKVASGSTTPELVAAALRALGVPVNAAAGSAPPTEARPSPSLVDHPDQGPPDGPQQPTQTPPGDDGLLGASEVMVYRALERAGNRLRTRIGGNLPSAIGRVIPSGTPAAEVHLYVPVTTSMLDDLMADAFCGLDRYTVCRRVDSNVLAARLDSYVRSLLVSRAMPDSSVLSGLVASTPSDGFLAKVG